MKSELYRETLEKANALISDGDDFISGLSNLSALLKESFNFWWVGFYIVRDSKSSHGKSLFLGPFQGPVACQRIEYGKGVCGSAWKKNTLINVPNVHDFPGHIACSSFSNSEIVVPISTNGEVQVLLDIDSKNYAEFDEVDEKHLVDLAQIISHKLLK